jgi:hypothetical protein
VERLGFSSIPAIRPSRISATPNRSASGTSLSRIFAPAACLMKSSTASRTVPAIMLSPKITQIFWTVREMFSQRQRVGDAALAFPIGVIQMLQSKFPAIGQQPEEVSGIPAGDHQDLAETGSTRVWIGNKCLLVILVSGDKRLPEPPARTARQYGAFQRHTPPYLGLEDLETLRIYHNQLVASDP